VIDFLLYLTAGAFVGFAVGLTGVGGGSLMTPLLLLFGFPAHTAIGTDLLYAALTKGGGVWMHARRATVEWRIVLMLASGSIPASILTITALSLFFDSPDQYAAILTSCLGAMLVATSLVLLFKHKLQKPRWVHHDNCREESTFRRRRLHSRHWTVFMGAVLGVLVTLSSVGAGAFGAAILMMLYPKLRGIQVIGTDLAHAVPLTLVAGIGHMAMGHVDYALLLALLTGSLPAIYAGTQLASRLPDSLLQPVLASMLLALGIKYAFF
jgi:uncharacterized membrane protein YfcA